MYRILDAFITPRAISADERLNEINTLGYITQIFTYGLQTLIGDGFMVRQPMYFNDELPLDLMVPNKLDLPHVHCLGS